MIVWTVGYNAVFSEKKTEGDAAASLRYVPLDYCDCGCGDLRLETAVLNSCVTPLDIFPCDTETSYIVYIYR